MLQQFYLMTPIRRTLRNHLSHPITAVLLLSSSVIHIDSIFSGFNQLVLQSLVLLIFIFLVYDRLVHRLACDITFSSDHSVTYSCIKVSKIDPFRLGCTIPICTTQSNLNSSGVTILFSSFLASFVLSLFRWCDCILFVTCCVVTTPGLPHIDQINTHSFRIGGAYAAF